MGLLDDFPSYLGGLLSDAVDRFRGRDPATGEADYWNRGGIAGLLGMPAWYEQPPIDIAMGFAGGVTPAVKGLAGAIAKPQGISAYHGAPKPQQAKPDFLPADWRDRGRVVTLRDAKDRFPDITEAQAREVRDLYLREWDDYRKWLSAETSAKRKYVRDFLAEHGDDVKRIHKIQDLEFTALPVSSYREIPGELIHKSPVYNRRQSSEYRVGVLDDAPIYMRKSNHWGPFSTNVTDIDEAVKLGMSRADAERALMNDPFGRITSKRHNWRLLGGNENYNTSQAGYLPIDDNLIDILRKYGIGGLSVGTGGLLGGMGAVSE